MSIVINQRNVLDKMISGATNDLMREEMGKQLHGSHCSPQDTKCIDEHLNAHVDLPRAPRCSPSCETILRRASRRCCASMGSATCA